MARRYPPEVHAFIRENVVGRPIRELTALLNETFPEIGFTESAVKAYMSNNKLRNRCARGLPKGHASRAFPNEIVEYIRGHYRGVGPAKMTEDLNTTFGTHYTVSQLKGYYANHKLNSGITGYFEKGHVPVNKGKKGCCAPGCEKTQFRKGNLPATTKPIGYERITKDGYVEVKVKMRPSSPDRNDNFVAKHRLIWEKLHGPIPKDSVVIFKDGDKQNFDPDNLLLITKAERLQMTRRGLFSSDPKMTETGALIAKVETSVFKRIREKKE